MLGINELIGFGAGGKTPASVTYVTQVSDTTTASPQTFASVNIGAADPTRRVIVVVHSGTADGALTSATIGGVAATIHVSAADGTDRMNIISALVPTGTTADIILTYALADVGEIAIGIFRALNLTSSTAFDSQFDATDVVSMTVDIPADGILIAGCMNNTAGAQTTVGFTEAYDVTIADDQATAGYASGLPAETNRVVSFDGAGAGSIGVACSWA